jgi:hypothetical protein
MLTLFGDDRVSHHHHYQDANRASRMRIALRDRSLWESAVRDRCPIGVPVAGASSAMLSAIPFQER